MANFKGFKQVSLATYNATSEENRKDYLWLVRELSGETVLSAAIYFGNRKYADLTGEVEDARVSNIINSLGDAIDANGEWVGFLPIEEHELLANSAVTSVSVALSILEAAILANESAISGKVNQAEYDNKIAELEADIAAVSAATGGDVTELSGSVITLEGKVATAEDNIADLSDDVDALEARAEQLETAVSAISSELETKADADDVYTKDEVYTKEEIDAKVAGAFEFKGNASAISADETVIYLDDSGEGTEASEDNVGFVYQIEDAEYASNGLKWVKLGFNIDLSTYATKDFVNSAISEEAAAREALADDVELVESALTAEIAARQALEGRVESVEDRATITARTYSDAAAMQNLELGRIIYVTEDETESGITYTSGAYINTAAGLKKLDSTTPSTSTTLEERVEALENDMAGVEAELGNTAYSGGTITEAIAVIQSEHVITGDDVEE